MSITGAIVLFAVLWFLVFFVVLQVRHESQGDRGDVVPGTPPGAPAFEVVGRKAKITTGITLVLWAAIAAVIIWGGITVQDLDWFGRLGPREG